MSNIAEGFDRGGNRELFQFLTVVHGSTAQVCSQLDVVLDTDYIHNGQFDALKERLEEISQRVGGLRRHLKNSSYKGRKHH